MFHQGKVLVTSSQTGFDIEYLVELAARIQISSVTFEGKINLIFTHLVWPDE